MTKKTVSDFHIDTQITQLGRDPASQSGFVNAPVYRIYRGFPDYGCPAQ